MSTDRTCPTCGSSQRALASFCDQCGAQLSSAGMQTRRLTPGEVALAQPHSGAAPAGAVPVGAWGMIDGYALTVHRTLRGIADDKSSNLVAEFSYRSQSDTSLRCSPSQWALHDSHGYVYGWAMYKGTFLGEYSRRLPDEQLLPDRTLRGWVAFTCPPDAQLSHLRFRASVHAADCLEFALPDPEHRDLA